MNYDKIYVIGWHHIWGGVVDGVVNSLAHGFCRSGYHATTIIIKKNEVPSNLVDLLQPGPRKLVIGVTHVSLFFSIDGKYLWQLIDADFATYFIDNPAFFAEEGLKHLLSAPEEMTFLFADNSQKRQFKSYLLSHGRSNECIFFPFGGNDQFNENKNSSDERETPKIIVFANLGSETPQFFHTIQKSLYHFPIISNSGLPNSVKDYIINELPAGNYDHDIFDLFSSFTAKRHLYMDKEMLHLFLATDSYLKRYRRLLSIWELRDFNIDIYGTGWKENAGLIPPLWNLFEGVDYSRQYEIFLNADIVLNVDPVWPEGIHDRVLNAMSCGAIPLTNFNKLTPFFLDSGIDSLVYKSAQEIPQLILSHITNLGNIKMAAHRSFSLTHHWRYRINSLVERLNHRLCN